MKQYILAFGATLLLSGCGIYTRYEAQTTVPDNLYGDEAETVATDTVGLGDIGWRDFFSDPYLQELIERGLAQNTDVLTAGLRIEEAQAALLSAKLAFLPSFALAPQGSLGTVESQVSRTYILPVTASWELDIFGKLRNAKRQAKAAYAQSEDYQQAVYSSLIANIANNYYTLLMLDEQLAISRETAASWKETVASTQALIEQISQVENSLSLLLAETPHSFQRGKLSEQEFTSELSTGIPLRMLSQRPDVRMAERQLEQAFYVTNQANSAFYPFITLSGSAGWTNSVGSIITNPAKFVTSALASLTQPLFNRGALIGQRRIAKAQQEEALLAFRQQLLNAGSEVNDALVSYQTSKKKKENYRHQITALERAYTGTSLLMENGNTTYLEVLTARQSLLSAQLSQTANQFKEIQSLINLYQALGGGRNG